MKPNISEYFLHYTVIYMQYLCSLSIQKTTSVSCYFLNAFPAKQQSRTIQRKILTSLKSATTSPSYNAEHRYSRIKTLGEATISQVIRIGNSLLVSSRPKLTLLKLAFNINIRICFFLTKSVASVISTILPCVPSTVSVFRSPLHTPGHW